MGIILSVIIMLESGGDASAYNLETMATGLMQITPICLADYNLYSGEDRFTMEDMNHEIKNMMVGSWYLNKRIPQLLEAEGIPVTVDTVLWAWHAGIGNVIKNKIGPKTLKFIEDYKREVSKHGRKN